MFPPSKLEIALARAGYPTLRPHAFTLTDPAGWYTPISGLIDRHFCCGEELGEVLSALGLDPGCAAYIGMRFTAALKEPIAKQFKTASMTHRCTPRPLCLESARQRAAEIGRAVSRSAQRRPHWTRHVMSIYAQSATTDGWVELASLEESALLNYGKQLIAFVDGLHMLGLEVGLVGFRGDHGQTDMDAWIEALGLKGRNPHGRIINARNLEAKAAVEHMGLEVVRWRPSGKVAQDGACHSVMVVGALVEAWRFAMSPASRPCLVRPSWNPPQNLTVPNRPVCASSAEAQSFVEAMSRLAKVFGPRTIVRSIVRG